jgi:hypothetical protein
MGRMMPLAAAVCLMAAPAAAADGLVLVQSVTTGSGTAMTHQIDIDAHRMRMESGGGPAGSQVFIFDGTRQVMIMVNPANKTYSEISKADLDALSGQMSAAMSQMQEAMKNMPPEQRARVEAMMKGRMGGAAAAVPARPVYKNVGTDKVGKWTCDKYEGTTNGQKTSELCTVDPKVLGLNTTDFAVTKDFADFFGKLIPSGAAQAFRVGSPEDQGFSGVPVRSVYYGAGQPITSEITDIHHQAFTDATFQPPAGFTKTESPFSGRGRRGR